jgi:hypothetical protein
MTNQLARGAAALLLAVAFAAPAGAQATAPPATTPAPPPGTACVRARDLASAEEFAAHQGRLRAAQTEEQRAQELATFMTEMRTRAEQSLCRDVMGGPGMGAPGGPRPADGRRPTAAAAMNQGREGSPSRTLQRAVPARPGP